MTLVEYEFARTDTVLQELSLIFSRHGTLLAAYAAWWTALHFGLDALLRCTHAGAAATAALSHKRRAGRPAPPPSLVRADIRNRIIAVVHSVTVTVLCGALLVSSADIAASAEHLYGSTPLSRHLCAFACTYFAWDAVVSVLEAHPAPMVVHHLVCCAVFLAGLRPFCHHTGLTVLLFEASTILLQWRGILQMAGQTRGRLFYAVSVAFTAVFAVTRLGLGWWELGGQWAPRMLALLREGSDAGDKSGDSQLQRQNPRSVVLALLTAGLLLCALNAWWMWEILKVLSKQAKPGRSGAGERTPSDSDSGSEGAEHDASRNSDPTAPDEDAGEEEAAVAGVPEADEDSPDPPSAHTTEH